MRRVTILILFLLASCTVTKKHLYTEKEFNKIVDSIKVNSVTKIVDTLEVEKVKVITDVVETVLEIPIECDEEGNVKDLNYQIKSGKSRIKAIIKGNSLRLEAFQDSLKNVYEKEYRSKNKSDSLAIEQRLKEKYTKEIKETKVQQPWNPLKHLYCYIIILLLVVCCYLVWRIK